MDRCSRHGAWRACFGGRRKNFFFEKKKQKNFCDTWPSLPGKAEAETNKSFLLLFFEKEDAYFLTRD
jgi:hypothetical protein